MAQSVEAEKLGQAVKSLADQFKNYDPDAVFVVYKNIKSGFFSWVREMSKAGINILESLDSRVHLTNTSIGIVVNPAFERALIPFVTEGMSLADSGELEKVYFDTASRSGKERDFSEIRRVTLFSNGQVKVNEYNPKYKPETTRAEPVFLPQKPGNDRDFVNAVGALYREISLRIQADKKRASQLSKATLIKTPTYQV